ncbi:MAG: hypothetical protein L6R38_008785 [Xanthoria sp. 2 TBL-2021]|nr:MAG: hypothetical protein L6R38_008785 [Xanthoria sp. 2 TBL-2021]
MSTGLFKNLSAPQSSQISASLNQTNRCSPASTALEGNVDNKPSIESALLQSIKRFYDEGQYTDLIIVCGEEELKCHKVILCAQSEYFKTACNNLSGDKSKLYLSEEKLDHIKIMLEFLYTQTYDLSKQVDNKVSRCLMIIHLYAMGERFAIPKLQQHAHDDFEKMVHGSRDTHDGTDFLLSCISTVYYSTAETDRSLRDILVEGFIHHYHSSAIERCQLQENALLEAANDIEYFRKDLILGLLRSGKEGAKPALNSVLHHHGFGGPETVQKPTQSMYGGTGTGLFGLGKPT